jgi:hypothetical protein
MGNTAVHVAAPPNAHVVRTQMLKACTDIECNKQTNYAVAALLLRTHPRLLFSNLPSNTLSCSADDDCMPCVAVVVVQHNSVHTTIPYDEVEQWVQCTAAEPSSLRRTKSMITLRNLYN